MARQIFNFDTKGTDTDDTFKTTIIVNSADPNHKTIGFTYEHKRESAGTVQVWTGQVELQQLTNLFEVMAGPGADKHTVVFAKRDGKPLSSFKAEGAMTYSPKSVILEVTSSEHRASLHRIAQQAIKAFKPGAPPTPKTS